MSRPVEFSFFSAMCLFTRTFVYNREVEGRNGRGFFNAPRHLFFKRGVGTDERGVQEDSVEGQ